MKGPRVAMVDVFRGYGGGVQISGVEKFVGDGEADTSITNMSDSRPIEPKLTDHALFVMPSSVCKMHEAPRNHVMKGSTK